MGHQHDVSFARTTITTMEKHQYIVNLQWTSDRKGIICSPDISSATGINGCLEVATPPQFPKGIEGTWSPEHLYTAAVTSCFMTTFLAIADNSKLQFSGFTCKAVGILELIDRNYLMTEVILEPTVTLVDSQEAEKALRILIKAEAACLISNSIRSKVSMKPVVREREAEQMHKVG